MAKCEITNQTAFDGFKKRVSGPFTAELWKRFASEPIIHFEFHWDSTYHTDELHDEYKKLCGRSVQSCRTVDEFFHPALISELTAFFGKDETDRIVEECRLVMEFPYSHEDYRPSYRSARAGDYYALLFTVMSNSLFYQCYGFGRLHTKSLNRIALDLRRGDPDTYAIVEEAITGNNTEELFSQAVISAIVKSGEQKALELLGKLMLAAKRQEGLRQAILETCDSGTVDSHKYFIKLILDNGLCRFSSVIRAFDTWCGLSFGDQKQKTVEKMMALALRLLDDENAARAALSSADTTEIYMGLWALAVRDLHSATDSAVKLLESAEKYRRLTGWYFITNTNNDEFKHELAVRFLHINDDFRHQLAARFLHVRDYEELAWVALNIKTNSRAGRFWGRGGYLEYELKNEKENASKEYPVDYYPADAKDRALLFEKAALAAEYIGKKSGKFSPSVFPWCSVQLSAANLFGLMIGLAAYDRSEELTLKIAEELPIMDSDNRYQYYCVLLNPETPRHRALLLKGLGDKSPTVKEIILKRLMFYPLNTDALSALEKTLLTTNATLRKTAVTLLGKQETALIIPVIDRLLNSDNNNQVLAGTELLEIHGKKQPDLIASCREKISALRTGGALGEDFEILTRRIYPDKSAPAELTPENGFGLFDPNSELFLTDYWAKKRPAVEALSDAGLKARIVPDYEAVAALYKRLLDVVERNKDYEYEAFSYSGGKETAILGSRITKLASVDKENPKGIYDYPLAEEWLAAAGDFKDAPEKLASVLSIWGVSPTNKDYKSWFVSLFDGYAIASALKPAANKIYDAFRVHDRMLLTREIDAIIRAIICTAEKNLFDFSLTAYVNLINKIPADKLSELCYELDTGYHYYSKKAMETEYFQYWRQLAYRQITGDEDFKAYFSEMWYEYLASGKEQYYGLKLRQILHARELGLITDELVYYYLLMYPHSEHSYTHPFGELSNKRRAVELFKQEPCAKAIFDKALDTIVSVESKRGELPTLLTHIIPLIERFTGGITHFVTLLAALGDGGFSRASASYYRSSSSTKKDSLSHLLRRCQPCDTDTPEGLRAALKNAKIPERRTIQVALFAPAWAGLLEQALGIAGLKCGVWFFHAHINEDFSAEKETEVAIFSSITPQRFNDGAFDKDWFFEAYNTLGEQRFTELYKSAKLITESNIAHRRSQLYTDAVLGRMDKAETLTEIKEKRNQERLRAYALIPLDKKNKSDALERYEYINLFIKESRQFGASRQASEGKAAAAALDNLAITTGYGDADRMTWALEGQKTEQLRPLMEPRTIGETTVRLVIHPDGMSEVETKKKGKILITLPKELNKDEYVADLKAAAKALREQKSRARLKFEMAMVSRTAFKPQEIVGLLQNPVLCGQVKDLVFVSGDVSGDVSDGVLGDVLGNTSGDVSDGALGFPVLSDGNLGLKSFDDTTSAVSADVIIAHPYDFMRRKCWSKYQQYIFKNQIKQPFKQIFREYYPITEDELKAANISTRYEGYQVQPKKTVALLKTRGWTVDYEDGLQRVWYKENLVARMYAMADWFSPSDVEAPTLETIQFFRRGKWERVPFDEVPPVVFSETMRDIDLVVSVAYVGGVDPEASHSTVEMRVAIARELLALLAVKNVNFKTAHAIIQGKLGEYSVHLGSGITHKMGTGMIAVLPVHSQHRGRVFLPFADDDPKTAEIMSKILLFAEDTKIKDPGILSQIRGE